MIGAAGSFNDQAPIFGGVIEQVAAAQHVDTGNGSLDGLISALVAEIVSALGGVGATALQENATVLVQTAKNFHAVGNGAQGH